MTLQTEKKFFKKKFPLLFSSSLEYYFLVNQSVLEIEIFIELIFQNPNSQVSLQFTLPTLKIYRKFQNSFIYSSHFCYKYFLLILKLFKRLKK